MRNRVKRINTLNDLWELEHKQFEGKTVVFICETEKIAERLLHMGLSVDEDHVFFGAYVFWCDMTEKPEGEKLH